MPFAFYQQHRGFFRIVVLILTVSFLIAEAHAANEAAIVVSVGAEGITRKIVEGETLPPITFHLSEESGEFTAGIMLYTDDLVEEGGGRSIQKGLININPREFVLKENDVVEINITVDTRSVEPGIYAGRITVHADNATDRGIPLKIQISKPIIYAALLNFLGVVAGLLFVLVGIVIPPAIQRVQKQKAEKKSDKLSFTVAVISEAGNQFSQENIWKNITAIVAFILVVVVVFAMAFVAYYPRIAAFGANPTDYIAAFLFGLSQVGASKITADMFKNK